MNKDAEVQMVKEACFRLIEHFDSVQIFCTRHAPELDGTANIQYGCGNFFARYGQISAWLLKEENEISRPSDLA